MKTRKIKTKKWFLILGLAIVILYFFTRLYNLALLPVFFDEANYIYWAKDIAATNHHWFRSLAGGKPFPLIWLMAFFLKILPAGDYMVAGRLPSVAFGFITLLGVYKLGKIATNSTRATLLAAFLFVILPFSLFHDRMALYDSQLSAMLTWMLYFFLKTLKSLKTKDAVLWGSFLGFALHAKASALALEILTPLLFLILSLKTHINFKKCLVLITVVIFISQAVANVNIVSSGFRDYLVKSLDYVPTGGITTTPLRENLFPNLILSWQWFWGYFTFPLFIFGLISLVFYCRKFPRQGFVFVSLIIIPVVVFSYLGRIFFPRYFLFMVPYLLIPTAYLLSELSRKNIFLTVIFFCLLVYFPLRFDYLIISNPANAPFPAIDRSQYITGSPSGYGLDQIFSYLDQKLSNGEEITLIIQGSYSQYPNAFLVNYWGNRQITILERWPLTSIDQEIYDAVKKSQVYILLPQRFNTPENKVDLLATLPVTVLLESRKPGGENTIYLTTLK